jgi:tetratricopeptide (TPR) repeat protein
VTANLSALRARFDAKPDDAAAFGALEEALFVAGEWADLVAIYERRLAAADLVVEPGAKLRARVVLRLAQVLEERCGDEAAALARYREAVALDPTLRPALAQLRRLLTRAERWDEVLTLADAEANLPMRPFERAQLATELGTLWLEKRNEPEQAKRQFERALAAEGKFVPALLGLASVAEASGAYREAANALEQAILGLRGVERAAALVRLARLQEQHLGDAARAHDTYRRALTDDPLQLDALEAVASRAQSAQQWALFDELQDRRFALAKDRLHKLAIAHDAGRVQLEEVRNPQGARLWFRRALDLFPSDPVVHLYLADVERISGNQAALAEHLRRAAELADNAAPVEVLQESARLEQARGDAGLAIAQLRRALERDPSREDVAEQLAELLAHGGREDELVELLEALLSDRPGGAREAALWTRLASFHEQRRDDAATALEAYGQALDAAPADAAALAGFERSARKLERWDALRERLARTPDVLSDAAEKAAAHVRHGDLLLERFEDLEAARAAYTAALEADPEQLRARQGLERIALASGDDEAIAASFEREAAATSDRARLAFLVGELARICEARGEPARALGWVLRLADARPEDAAPLAHAARLQEALGDTRALCATLTRLDPRLAGREQVANRRRLAALHGALGDAASAIEAHRAVLAAEPADVSSARALVALLSPDAQLEEHIAARRALGALSTGAERVDCHYALGCLLMDRAGDLRGAGACFDAIADAPGAPDDVEDRLTEILRRLGQWDVLCARLALQRALLDPLDPRGFEIDLARAELLLDRLGRPNDAIALCETVREANPREARARELLERALRSVGDDAKLVGVLAERSALEADRERRALLDLERAVLFEERLRNIPEARSALEEIARGDSAIARDAERRLRQLLESERDWAALAERLASDLGSGDAAADVARHRELAALHRDRLNDPERAIEHLQRALALLPGDGALLRSLQALLQHQGREAELRSAFEAELAGGDVDAERARVLHGRCAELAELAGDLAAAERHHAAALAMDPGAARSVEFLAQRYEVDGRERELVGLLRARLSKLPDGDSASAALRLRIAALEADRLGDVEAAIAILAPAAERDELLSVVADPLAGLLQRAGRAGEVAQLALRALAAADSAGERAAWNVRAGDALARDGQLEQAVDCYRRALTERPADADVQGALRDLYRRLERPEPLARMLQAELARVAGPREVPLRLELAELALGPLAAPADALVQLRRVLELEPRNAEALERAILAAEQANAHGECAELLARAAGRTGDPERRARLLTRRGALLAGPLGRVDEAIACYEAALDAAPTASETLAALRGVLEDRGDWAGVLACFEREYARATPDPAERAGLVEEAARFAREMIGGDAALPWLERLRADRPADAETLARIADVHRAGGRAQALLRCLEEELALAPPPARRVELSLEAAAVLADALRAPARAASMLESAREVAPGHRGVLAALDGLYESLGRTRERLEVLRARIDVSELAERGPLRRSASALARQLGERAESAAQLWAALGECGPISHERADLLRELADDLRDRPDLWANVAEAELHALDGDAPVFTERRRTLRADLAEVCACSLARPEAAIAHLSRLLDGELSTPATRRDIAAREAASGSLVALLRETGDTIGLERRLTQHLAEFPASAAEPWLELGRLRLETLHHPTAAAAAYAGALERDPRSLPALRGLRAASELIGRWQNVASTLERELDVRNDAAASERASILRRLGDVAWRRLDETTRASRAYAGALEAEPHDLVSLRALQQLFEAMEDWRGAADLYESEVAVLSDAEPERRKHCWLRAAELARDRTLEPARALRCFDAAAAVSPLDGDRLVELAELLDRLGETARFVEVFAAWLDAPGSRATPADELRLARALDELERYDAALARAERAVARAPELAAGWDFVAVLRLRLGRRDGAADAFSRAAVPLAGSAAAERRIRAAGLLAEAYPQQAVVLLEQATRDEPLSAEAFARLALAAQTTDSVEHAERAAERAIALAGDGRALARELRRDAALAGARAAQALDHLTAAARLLSDVLAIEPDHPEALGQQGRTLLRLGDVAGAREALARALELSSEPRDRALTLALLGNAESAARATDAALAHYRAALAIDPGLEDAHAGLAQLLVREQREAEAIEALLAWSIRASSPRERAERLLQAAELELSREDLRGDAERHLREALEQEPALSSGWALLAELLAKQARWAELIEAARSGAAATDDALTRSRLEVLRGRALEQRGDLRGAAEAFSAASRENPRGSEATLSAARLLRGLGEWQAAADVLRSFIERAPEDARAPRATALHQLGRLLAGPLEQVDGAVEVYRQAIALDADHREGKEALADLLLHRPRHWDEALARHRELLASDPTRIASLRGLLRIARGRGNAGAASMGLGLLRALGAATAEEAREAPARLPLTIAAKPGLADPRFELARRLAQEMASELAEALGGAPRPAAPGASADASARFRAAVTAAEGELSAPALVPLATHELAGALALLAEIGSDVETVSASDGGLVNALSRAIGWRAKKRLRRALEGRSPEEIASIDFAAWRCALRGLASALVVDRGECNLREAFVAFIQSEASDGARSFAPEADLRALVAAHPEARELLRLAIAAWLTNL